MDCVDAMRVFENEDFDRKIPVLGVFELGNFQLLLQHQSMDAVSISRLVSYGMLVTGEVVGKISDHTAPLLPSRELTCASLWPPWRSTAAL